MEQESRSIDLTEYQNIDIAIVSDTHGKISDDVAELVASTDVVLHAGDIMGGEVLRKLRPKSGRIIAVKGNNDFDATWEQADREMLDELPDVAVVRCVGGDIVMEHGHLVPQIETDHFSLAYKYAEARVVVYGHTHIQRADIETTPWLINPGAAGQTRTGGGPSCAILSIKGADWNFESFRFPDAA